METGRDHFGAIRNIFQQSDEAEKSAEERTRHPFENVFTSIERNHVDDRTYFVISSLRVKVLQARHQAERMMERARGQKLMETRKLHTLLVDFDKNLTELELALCCSWHDDVARLLPDVRRQFDEIKKRSESSVRLREPEPVKMVMLPRPIAAVYYASEKVLNGTISIEQWSRVLDNAETEARATQNRVSQGMAARASQGIEPNAEEIEHIPLLHEELEESVHALNRMRNWIDSNEVDDLNKGWEALVMATQSIQYRFRTLIGVEMSTNQSDSVELLEDK